MALGPPEQAERGAFVRAYLSALQREIEAWHGPVCGRTLYVGGGTPTWLQPDQLTTLLDHVRQAFTLPARAEVTLEANPGTLDASRLAALSQAGVNRLSLGVQSFDDACLGRLGRIHSAAAARQTFHQARAAGFRNINLDLMFGLPQQSLPQWEDSLQQALNLEPEHISLYCLEVEEGTPLAAEVRNGIKILPSPEIQADMYGRARQLLSAQGYAHYEISNFARPGYACRHNDIYWRNEPYLGFGAGACSYWNEERFCNLRNAAQYIAALQRGPRAIGERERLSRRGQMGETMMLGLRRTAGVNIARFRERFGDPPEEVFAEEVAQLVRNGLLTTDGTHWKLTPQSLLLANQVFMEFV